MSACLEIQPGLSMNQVGTIDHYTLIVECAETVAHFHADVLGFELLEIRPLNTGSAEPGCYDMLNYIMRAPDGSGRTIVITEGLTDQSFFRKHLREHGPGIHHVAYQVDTIEDAMAAMCARGAEFQSETPVTDPRSGLKQVFLKVPGAGYTIELIERGDGVESEVFQDNNMTGLVESVTESQASASRGRPGDCKAYRYGAGPSRGSLTDRRVDRSSDDSTFFDRLERGTLQR